MIFGRRKQQLEMEAEIEHHRELLEEDHRVRGLSPEEARHAAQRDIGGTLRARELYRDQQGLVWLDHLRRDLRQAFRSLGRTPGLAVAVIATLALGIGANTAIFGVVRTVQYRPLPFKEPDRLMWITGYNGPIETKSFESLTKFGSTDVVMEQDGFAYSVHAAFSSKPLTNVLGVKLFAGRDASPEEEILEHELPRQSVALISHRLFLEQYSGDLQVLGRSVRMWGTLHTIIGILPPDFRLPLPRGQAPQFEPDVIIPQGLSGQLIGRLRPGATPQAAADELQSMNTLPQAVKAKVVSLHDHIVGGTRRELLVLSIAVACVLLIACVNVTNLLLARSLTRTQETSVRTALGASRVALLRGVFAETGLLSICGGACGVFLAAAILNYIASLRGTLLPRLPDVRMDVQTIAFAAACCVVTAMLAAVGPMLSVLRPSLIPAIRRGGESHASQSRSMRWFHNSLAAAQIAIALLLVSAAGLLLKSLNLSREHASEADPRHVVVSRIDRDTARMPRPLVYEQNQEVLRRLRLLPGVRAAAIYTDYNTAQTLNIDGSPRPFYYVQVQGSAVSDGFFAASGYRLLAGRLFNEEEQRHATGNTPQPLIVNRAFIREFAPTFRSLDQAVNLDIDFMTNDRKRERLGRIIGIVSDLNLRNVAVQPQEFRPLAIVPNMGLQANGLVIRTIRDPEDLKKGAQNILRIHDLRLLNPETLEDRVNASVATRQFETNLLTAFAALALTLAIIGIYGVLSYAVSQRTREIGIRVALGASRTDVLGAMLCDGWKLTLAGIAAGLAGSLAFTQTMRSMLTNVEPTDPLVLASVCALIFTIATLAALIPARRATRIDPLNALRYE